MALKDGLAKVRPGPKGRGADGSVAPGGAVGTVPEMATALRSICAPRLLNSATDTRPGVTIKRNTLACIVRSQRAKTNRHDDSLGWIGVLRRARHFRHEPRSSIGRGNGSSGEAAGRQGQGVNCMERTHRVRITETAP